MKTKLKLNEFFKITGINYDEDVHNLIYHEYENLPIDDMIERLPERYQNCITKELLENDNELEKDLRDSFNSADYDALVEAAYDKRNRAVETYSDKLVDYVNTLSDTEQKALNSIFIDWDKDVAIIDFNPKEALSTTREIINGEGMFYYEDDKALATVIDGKYSSAKSVIMHLHYLLNAKLIDSIFRIVGYPRFEWEVDYYSYTPEMLENRLSENVPDRYLSLPTIVNKAINLSTKIDEQIKQKRYDTKKLYEILEQMNKKDKQLYEQTLNTKNI